MKGVLVGCGRMGAHTSESVFRTAPDCWFPLSHLEAMQSHPRIEVSAICDISEDLLDKTIEKYGSLDTYSDVGELLRETQPDVVCLATRTMGRAAIILEAIRSGVKGIHTEKPICNSLSEFVELENAFSQHQVALTYGTIRRYAAIYRQAKSLVTGGEFGKLQHIQVNFGLGQLFWTHPHSVDLIHYFADGRHLESVQANLSGCELSAPNVVDTDPYIKTANLFFEEGLVASITQAPGMDLILHCEGGTVSVEGDGSRLISRSLAEGRAYLEFPPRVHSIERSVDPQGTGAAIRHLVEQISSPKPFDGHYVFEAHRWLFLLVQSHLQEGVSVDASSLQDLRILARSGEFFA